MIRLTLPVPPPTNKRIIGLGTRRGYAVRKKCKEYQQEVRRICDTQKLKPFKTPVAVCLVWYRSSRRGDIGDRFKDLFDSIETRGKRSGVRKQVKHPPLKYGVYIDDKQIEHSSIWRSDKDRKHPRIDLLAWDTKDTDGWAEYFAMLPLLLGSIDAQKALQTPPQKRGHYVKRGGTLMYEGRR